MIASAVLLLLLAIPGGRFNTAFLGHTEFVAGVLFVLVGIAGLIFAGGFLDSRVLPLGQFGAFFSAGAIPVLSVLLGVKVGCEASVILDHFRRCRRDNGPISVISIEFVLTTGLALMLIGLWGALTHRNILRIIISLSLFGTGSHILIVAIGYVGAARRRSSTARCRWPKRKPARSTRSPPRWS